MGTCSSDNTVETDQSSFWSSNGIDWDTHRIGWAISGGCAALTLVITIFSVARHCRNYSNPAEQRQIIRILYMPPVFAIISFFSYRYFRSYTYYELIEVVYEAITISAFMLLLIEYVASTASDHSARAALERKDKQKLPIPFCCWRFRPTKAYFMYTMKWAVMQYVVIRPIVSVVAIVCQALNVLCENDGLSDFTHAYVYVSIVDFISISVALYGLLMFYNLTKDELKEKKPLGKFLCIKLIVFFTFYQSFVFSVLQGRVIHATQYWTETNVADGLNALATSIEMVFFAIAMIFCYSSKPYKQPGVSTGVWKPLLDSLNFSDFIVEIWSSLKFFIDYWRGKPGTHSASAIFDRGRTKPNFGEAFGFDASPGHRPLRTDSASTSGMKAGGYSASSGAGDAMRGYGQQPKAGAYGYGSSPYGNGASAGNGSGQAAGYDGRGASMEYGEDVRLTTFVPGSTTQFVNGGERERVDAGSPSVSTGMRSSDDTYSQPAMHPQYGYSERGRV